MSKRRAKHLAERKELTGAYQRLFDTPDGKKVLLDLCKQAGLTQFKADVHSLEGYYEVQRFMFSILRVLNTDPQVLLQQIEHLNRTTYEQMDHGSVDE